MKTTQQHRAYLTVANIKRIVSSYKSVIPYSYNFEFHKNLYKRSLFVFSNSELQDLAKYKIFIEKPEIYLTNFSKIAETKKDSGYIFNVNSPAYHNTLMCDYIHSDFINFFIPDVIKEQGHLVIERFVRWCEANRSLFESNRGAFEAKVRLLFKVSLNEIYRENSGVQDFSILDLSAIEQRIDSILDDAITYYNKEERYHAILDEFAHKTWILHKKEISQYNTTKFDDVEFSSVLMHYKISFKDPVMQLVREYYKQKYNPDFSFDTFLLDQLGFRKCKSCYKEQ